jgi:solute carrier family 13 (sodium-dependent dicarboxylate transporter), member 2/3/5
VATQTLPDKQQAQPTWTVAPALKLAAGPAAFGVVLLLPLGLSYEGRVSLATFVCAIVWWVTRPMPWGIAAMLPLIVFPAAGVMSIAATTQLYGHPIFFWIMGTVLVGFAIDKHGVAQRVALAFLALPGIGGRTRRLTFAYMLLTGGLSMFVSDAATIAMMCPIGMSLVRHIRVMTGAGRAETTRFAAFMTLGTMYAAVAGGTATVMGVPHNAIAVSLLERVTGRQLGFFEWMAAGFPVFLTLLVVFYLLLWLLTPPEIREVPSGEAFLRAEHAKLGPVRSNERRVLVVFAVMVTLFILPTIAALALADGHPFVAWAQRALPVWVVPPIVLLLLFTIPATGAERGTLLSWKDAEQQTPWNTMLLVVGGVAMTEALSQFGFIDLMGSFVKGLGIGTTALPYIAGVFVVITTDMISGIAATTLYCNIFIPAAVELGFNPASMAILIANVALGLVFPWAGAVEATTFAVGDITMGRMIRIGIVASAVFVVVTATIHLLLSPYV